MNTVTWGNSQYRSFSHDVFTLNERLQGILEENQQLHEIIKELNEQLTQTTKSLQQEILWHGVTATALEEDRAYMWRFVNDSGEVDFRALWTERNFLKAAIHKLEGVVEKFESELEDKKMVSKFRQPH